MDRIYFDHNATAPVTWEVQQAMAAIGGIPLNASSVHSYGRQAKKYLEEARQAVYEAVHAKDAEVIFTSSGTEANNLALQGCNVANWLVSAIEHASVLKAVEHTQRIPVTKDGLVDTQALARLLRNAKGKTLVSVMLANNETGIIQPVKEISTIAHNYGAIVHCDAAQALGKIPVDMVDLGVDMLTVSSHKIGGPQGAAALVIRKGGQIRAQVLGGGQERGYRAGTENVAAIYGFGIATKRVEGMLSHFAELQEKRNAMEHQLREKCEHVAIIGEKMLRLPNTSCIAMPYVPSETQLMHFDLAGIAVSSGSACSSGKIAVSHVLLAMGIPHPVAASSIRVSLGHGNTEEEIHHFTACWLELYHRLKQDYAAYKVA